MRSEPENRIRLSSGTPWHLTVDVSRLGADLLCRVEGGDSHVGSVALAEWRDGRAHTRALTAEGHRETAIARHAAHRLCAATRRTVTCVAGIHFDDLSRAEIDEISAQAYELAIRASTMLRDERLQGELGEASGVYQRIMTHRGVFAERLTQWFEATVEAAIAATSRAAREGGALPGRAVRIFAPLYLSNACTNDCVYCGFRRSSSYERSQLTVAEAVEQADVLSTRGIRDIDLVTGEIPTDRFVDYVCESTAAILARTAITRIHLNLGSLAAEQYARLRDAGAAGYHLYQETYDPAAYFGAHRDGGKREMAARLEAPSRAAEAGFPYLGLGVLLGLADPLTDLASLAAHAALLMKDHPELEVGFSLPRIRSTQAAPEYRPTHPVSDDDFVRAVLFLRTEYPSANVTVTTREPPHIRDLLIHHGATRISAGVSTAPGGYGSGAIDRGDPASGAREQFEVADQRSVAEIAAVVAEAGLPLSES